MIERYGTEGGFGWKLNEIVGAQVVFVPASKVLQSARQSLIVTMSIVVAVFALVILLVNFWLRKAVVRPITRMAQVAEVVSQGNLDAEFQKWSNDEVGKLSDAFSRLRTSFVLAMKKLDKEKRKNRPSQE
jgi:signal transduction histidine kinase